MKNNIIQMSDRVEKKAQEIALFSVAKALNVPVENVVEEMVKRASELMAKVPDGYILYRCDGMTRAALVINAEVYGQKFPFIFHSDSDDDESEPVGLLYADMEYEFLGAFIDYLVRDDNMHWYHSLAHHIPQTLGGIGFIQAIHNAKQQKLEYFNDLDVRRVSKLTVAQLQR